METECLPGVKPLGRVC